MDIVQLITFCVTVIFFGGIYFGQLQAMNKKLVQLEEHNEEQDRRLNKQDVVLENINVNLEYIKHQLDVLNENRNN